MVTSPILVRAGIFKRSHILLRSAQRRLNRENQMRSAKYLSLPLPLCLVIFLSLIYTLPFDVRKAHFHKLEGKSFNGSLLERHLAQDFWDCLFLCVNAVNKNCFSFNFGGMQPQGFQECELTNSEMKLDPKKIQDRQGFTYYGMTDESLNRYLPCSSTPCLHGKDCISGPTEGQFHCECPLENIGLKFFDDKCTSDLQQIAMGTMMERVALTRFTARTLNFYEAEKLCKLVNASMASYDQLYTAWSAGLSVCVYGWISGVRAAFPIREALPGCGNRVEVITTETQDKNRRFHVWCYYN